MSPPEDATLYAALGDATLRRLVDHFYDAMDSLPEVQPIRQMHPADLTPSRDKLYFFLVGWCGGPPLYTSRYGHPRLRARHLPFAIGPAESAQWLLCMRTALDEVVADEDLRATLWSAFRRIAGHMENLPA